MKTEELVCVCCPKGCRITVTHEAGEVMEVKGYGCENGLHYGKQEITCPMRVLTSTVRIEHGTQRVLPVISEKEIPLHVWKQAMEEIRAVTVSAPVKINDVILENLAGTGVRLLASRSMAEK